MCYRHNRYENNEKKTCRTFYVNKSNSLDEFVQ